MKKPVVSSRSANTTKSNYANTVPYSLKGKMVTIYRGGPESKKGKLLEVKPDYIALFADNTIIYYQSEHIKSISEDSKANIAPDNLQEAELFDANDFKNVLRNFINQKVQVNQGGPESRMGVLLQVKNDLLVLFNEKDGVIYYNIHHIKSIKGLQNNDEKGPKEVLTEYIHGSDFKQIFCNLTHSWVAINRGGPEAVEGILIEDTDGFYTLVNNQELYRIHPFHVRNISSGPKGGNKQDNNNEDSQNEKSNENDNQLSSNDDDDNNQSNTTEGKSTSRHYSSRGSREKVIKTVDYVWKAQS